MVPVERGQIHAFAQVELGGLVIGIPAGCITRALPRPAALVQVPRSSTAVEGVFIDRGRALPLVDLRRWMAGGVADSVPPHVMVIDAQGRSLALALDAIRGIQRVPATRVRRLYHDAAADEFFHSVVTLDDGTLVSLLDPERLAAQVQAWAPADPTDGQHGQASGATARTNTSLFALVRIAGRLVAVNAGHAGGIERDAKVQPLDLGGSEIAGMLLLRGQQIPLLAGPGTLGLGTAQDGRGPLVMLLSDHGRALALPVDAVHSVQQIDESATTPADEAGFAQESFFSGLARTGDGDSVLVLDSLRLLDAYAVAGLSAYGAAAPASAQRHQDNAAEAHIVVHAGQDWAVPMECVHEIVPLPDDCELLPAAAQSVAGSMQWRGRTMPVLDIGGAAGRGKHPRLVVLQHGERHAALLATDLTALLPANAATRSRFRVGGGKVVEMLTAGPARARKSYQVLDLGALPFFAGQAASVEL